jgi:hypothetical protein
MALKQYVFQYLCNNLAKPVTAVCSDPFYGQTTSRVLGIPNFRSQTPNWMWNLKIQKKIEKKIHRKKIINFFFEFFFENKFHENAGRSVAFGEYV